MEMRGFGDGLRDLVRRQSSCGARMGSSTSDGFQGALFRVALQGREGNLPWRGGCRAPEGDTPRSVPPHPASTLQAGRQDGSRGSVGGSVDPRGRKVAWAGNKRPFFSVSKTLWWGSSPFTVCAGKSLPCVHLQTAPGISSQLRGEQAAPDLPLLVCIWDLPLSILFQSLFSEHKQGLRLVPSGNACFTSCQGFSLGCHRKSAAADGAALSGM